MSADPSRKTDGTRKRTYGRARRHSTAVSFLKRALPIAAFAVVGGFGTAIVLSGAFDGPVAATATSGVESGEIVMANPRLDGFDRNDRPYALTAEAARQAVVKPAVVALDTIDAKLPTDDDSFARIDATSGLYDTKQETLRLSEGVAVRGLKGMDMELESARFDMRAGSMTSDAPVAVRSANAMIDARSMEVMESGKRIRFANRVRMVIHNDEGKAGLLGDTISSTAPWIHTNKLSIGKFAAPADTPAVAKDRSVISIRGVN